MRNDAHFIKFWREKYGEADAARIQNLPYLEIDEKLGIETIFAAIVKESEEFQLVTAEEKIAIGKRVDALTVHAMEHLPWDQFVVHLPHMRRKGEADVKYDAFCVVSAKDNETGSRKVAITLSQKENGVAQIAISTMHIIDLATGRVKKLNRNDFSGLEHWLITVSDSFELFLTYTLNYLAMCPERVIETKSTATPSRQQRKAAQKDITERTDLSTYILLDPTKAPAYQPPEVRAMVESAGAKKTPHMRRSHWRRLPGKNVRVRQAWIGPKNWEYQGRAFRVVEAFGNSDSDCG